MRILSWLCFLPLALIAVSFALSNRETVLLTLWPLPFEMRLPLFAVGIAGLVLGFLAGALTLWILQLRARLRNGRKRPAPAAAAPPFTPDKSGPAATPPAATGS